jgi:hypothetical protein
MTFRFCGSAAASWCYGKRLHMQSVGQERNPQMFTSTLSAIWDQRQTSFIILQGFWLYSWNIGSGLSLSSTQHLNLFHVRAVTWERPGNADTWITISQKVLGLVYAELCQSAFSSMATRRNLTDQDFKELILHWCTFIARWWRFCSKGQWHCQWHRWHYWHKLHMLDWQYKLLTYCTYCPHVYRRSQWVMTQAPHINTGSSLLSIFMLFFLEIYNCW